MSRSLMTEATGQQLLTELRAIREEVEAVRRHLTTSLDAKSALRIWLAALNRSIRGACESLRGGPRKVRYIHVPMRYGNLRR